MTNNEKKRELALYRLRQAEETVDEAKFLLSAGKSPRVIINRAYYAMFYAVLALLVFEEYSSSKHSGIISYFNKKFTREGLLPKELGRTLNIAFDLRQVGDYKEYSDLTYAQVEPFVPKAEEFIQGVRDYLSSKKLI